jgi:heme-degrading monooxygenase HmoA
VYGRLTIIDGDPDRVDLLPEPEETTFPRPDEMPGLRALYCLIDRETGRGASLSIWDSHEAREASEERVARQRRQAEEVGGGRIVSIERMEVVNAITPPRA